MQINDVQFNCELEDVLKELKNQLSANGIQLLEKVKDSGKDMMVQCPYHGGGQEKRPSAGIRKSDGQFHCFACGETHSLPEVITYCFGNADPLGAFGWNWLLKNFLTVSVEEREDVRLDFNRDYVTNRKSRGMGDSRGLSKLVGEEELKKYRYIHPYMYKRKLTDPIIELFDIGYDKDSQSITFPIRDVMGNCLFVARRSVKTKWFNYPAGAEKPLYGLYELSLLDTFPDEIIVCESMLDALTCWVYGKYAVAMNGLGNELQFDQLRNLPCRELILATDNDPAGKKARKTLRYKIRNKLISEYIIPDGKKDINDLSEEEFKNLRKVY